MAGVLDPEEIEALMAGNESGDQSDGKYNLARQDYAVQRLIPTLSMIQSQFASAARDRLREFIPGIDSVRTDRITVMKFDELQGSLATPCSISLISGVSLSAGLLIAFESELVFQLVDQYFGGNGSNVANDRDQLSVSEASLMELLHRALLADVADAWKTVIRAETQIEDLQDDPRLLEGFHDSDSMVATRFAISFGEVSGGMWSVVPWSAIEAVRDSLGETGKPNTSISNEHWLGAIEEGLDVTRLDLAAVLVDTRMPLRRVSHWQVGDVLPLKSPDDVQLRIDGRTYLLGRFGVQDGQNAVSVVGLASQGSNKT